MRNWSVDTRILKKNKKQFTGWKLESLINFGLGKEKIDPQELKLNLNDLRIDPLKKNFLKFLLSA